VIISLEQAGKKFYREWIFRNISISFLPDEPTVVTGPNGSGKSTLLQVISGAVLPTEGKINFLNVENVNADNFFRHVSFTAPYLELIEEFTLNEIIAFHFKFKKPLKGISQKELISIMKLESNGEKVFKYFSSGMKQRVRLALAVFSDTKVLLLDEPCSNFDSESIDWYQQIITQSMGDRIVIVASNNQEHEYSFCGRHLNMNDFK
jgi:ABC-type multidrug transport system ATPase subunit